MTVIDCWFEQSFESKLIENELKNNKSDFGHTQTLLVMETNATTSQPAAEVQQDEKAPDHHHFTNAGNEMNSGPPPPADPNNHNQPEAHPILAELLNPSTSSAATAPVAEYYRSLSRPPSSVTHYDNSPSAATRPRLNTAMSSSYHSSPHDAAHHTASPGININTNSHQSSRFAVNHQPYLAASQQQFSSSSSNMSTITSSVNNAMQLPTFGDGLSMDLPSENHQNYYAAPTPASYASSTQQQSHYSNSNTMMMMSNYSMPPQQDQSRFYQQQLPPPGMLLDANRAYSPAAAAAAVSAASPASSTGHSTLTPVPSSMFNQPPPPPHTQHSPYPAGAVGMPSQQLMYPPPTSGMPGDTTINYGPITSTSMQLPHYLPNVRQPLPLPPPPLSAQQPFTSQMVVARMSLDSLRHCQGSTRVMLMPYSSFLSGQFPANTLLQMPNLELIQLIQAPGCKAGPVQNFFKVLHMGAPIFGVPGVPMPPSPLSLPPPLQQQQQLMHGVSSGANNIPYGVRPPGMHQLPPGSSGMGMMMPRPIPIASTSRSSDISMPDAVGFDRPGSSQSNYLPPVTHLINTPGGAMSSTAVSSQQFQPMMTTAGVPARGLPAVSHHMMPPTAGSAGERFVMLPTLTDAASGSAVGPLPMMPLPGNFIPSNMLPPGGGMLYRLPTGEIVMMPPPNSLPFTATSAAAGGGQLPLMLAPSGSGGGTNMLSHPQAAFLPYQPQPLPGLYNYSNPLPGAPTLQSGGISGAPGAGGSSTAAAVKKSRKPRASKKQATAAAAAAEAARQAALSPNTTIMSDTAADMMLTMPKQLMSNETLSMLMPSLKPSKKERKKAAAAAAAALNAAAGTDVAVAASSAASVSTLSASPPKKSRMSKKSLKMLSSKQEHDYNISQRQSLDESMQSQDTDDYANTPPPLATTPPPVGFSPSTSMFAMFRPPPPRSAAALQQQQNLSSHYSNKTPNKSRNSSVKRQTSRRSSLQNSNKSSAATSRSRNRDDNSNSMQGMQPAASSSLTDDSSQPSSATSTADDEFDDDDYDEFLLDDDDDDEYDSAGEADDAAAAAAGGVAEYDADGNLIVKSRNASRRRGSKSSSKRRRNSATGGVGTSNNLTSPFKKPHSPSALLLLAALGTEGADGLTRYSLASCDEHQAREIRRRLERKRREHIKGGYDRLKAAVPMLIDEHRAPPQRILEATLQFVPMLQQQSRKLLMKKIELLKQKQVVEAKFRMAVGGYLAGDDQPNSVYGAADFDTRIQSLCVRLQQQPLLASHISQQEQHQSNPVDDICSAIISNVYDAAREHVLSQSKPPAPPPPPSDIVAAEAAAKSTTSSATTTTTTTMSTSSSTGSLPIDDNNINNLINEAAKLIGVDDSAIAAACADLGIQENGKAVVAADEIVEINLQDTGEMALVQEDEGVVAVNEQLSSIEAMEISAADAVITAEPTTVVPEKTTAMPATTESVKKEKPILVPLIEYSMPIIDLKLPVNCRNKYRRFTGWKQHHAFESAVPRFVQHENSSFATSAAMSRKIIDETVKSAAAAAAATRIVRETDDDINANLDADGMRAGVSSSSSSWLSSLWPVNTASQLEYDYAARTRFPHKIMPIASSSANNSNKQNGDEVFGNSGSGVLSNAVRQKYCDNLASACTSFRCNISRFLKKVALVEALVEVGGNGSGAKPKPHNDSVAGDGRDGIRGRRVVARGRSLSGSEVC